MKKIYFVGLIILFSLTSINLFGQMQMQRQSQQAGNPFYHVEFSRIPMESKDSSRVVIYLKVPYDDLQFVKYDSVYQANYEISVVAFNVDDVQVDNIIKQRELEVASFEETNSREAYDNPQFNFVLGSGEYNFSVGLMDLDTRQTTYRRFSIDLKQFVQNAFQLSDLVVVDSILSDVKGELDFTAHVVNELNDREEDYYIYYVTTGDSGEAYVEGSVLDTEGNVIQSKQDTVFVTPSPEGHFIAMDLSDIAYRSYVYQLTLKRDSLEVVRKKDFQIGWTGLSSDIDNLDEAIEQMVYILPTRELRQMRNAEEAGKREQFTSYWDERDPTPNTPENELMDEYYRRIRFSSEQFGTSIQEGWRTDRGMVYVMFGPPNDIIRRPFELGSKPYQIWQYYNLNREFVFIDETGFGDYRLRTPVYDVPRRMF